MREDYLDIHFSGAIIIPNIEEKQLYSTVALKANIISVNTNNLYLALIYIYLNIINQLLRLEITKKVKDYIGRLLMQFYTEILCLTLLLSLINIPIIPLLIYNNYNITNSKLDNINNEYLALESLTHKKDKNAFLPLYNTLNYKKLKIIKF